MLQVDDIERLSRFLAGELSEVEAAQVRAELATNPELATALKRLERLDALAAEVAAAPPPMPQAAVDRAIASAAAPVAPAVRPRTSALRSFAGLAAAALAGAAVTYALMRVEPASEAATVQQAAAAETVVVPKGRAELFEGSVVERSGEQLVLRSGSAVVEGQGMLVNCGGEVLSVNGRALVSMEPEAVVSHVTRSAGPNSQGEDMQRLKAQWQKTPPSTAGLGVLLAVLSGTVSPADAGTVPAGGVYSSAAKPRPEPEIRCAPSPSTQGEVAPVKGESTLRTVDGVKPEPKVMLLEGMVPYRELREALMHVGPAAAKCFEKGRAQAPKLEGDVMLAITIVPSATGGRAEDVQVEGYTLQHPFVVSCVAQAVAALPFPAPTTPKAKVLVPLEFKSRGAAGEEGVQVFVPSVDDLPASMHMPDRAARVQVNTPNAVTLGTATAPVTLIALIDFECTFCLKAWAVLEQLMVQYQGRVKFVFLQRPLPFHKGARKAAEAAVAAGQQGRFKEFAALLFAEQTLHDDAGLDVLARRSGLDLQRFRQAMADGSAAKVVDAHTAEADRLGAKGTPTFFINGKETVGARPLATFQQLLDAELGNSRVP